MAVDLSQPDTSNDFISQAENLEKAGQSLLQAAVKLREAATLLGNLNAGRSAEGEDALPPRFKKDGELTRFGQLYEFIKKNMPVERQEIIDKSGVPEGSIRALLNVRFFDQDRHGSWSLKE